MSIIIEILVYSIEDVLRAKKGGAHRVELCADPGAGGTTPSYGMIKQAVAVGGMDTMVMVRPRGGDFLYSSEEIAVMRDDIQIAADLGATGIVLGMLDENGAVDSKRLLPLIQLAQNLGLEITFHRAFDVAADPRQALEDLIALGIDRVLTSGQRPTAPEGIDLLRELIDQAGERISVMPGGFVRLPNIAEILELNIKEIHTGGTMQVPSRMKATTGVKMGALETEFHNFVDPQAVQEIVRLAAKK